MVGKSIQNLKTRIAQGLTGWLTFEFACERGYLFSEYYLAHGMGQILREGVGVVHAERKHPALAVDGAQGRPPSVDFVAEDEDGEPLVAVETKWAGKSEVTAGPLLWDAFRLEAYARETGAAALLVLAGTREKLQTLFNSAAFQRAPGRGGESVPLLPLPGRQRKWVLERSELSSAAKKKVSEKISACPAGAISEKLYCTAPHEAAGPGSVAMSFATYVWEIRHGSL